ncbi:lysozyme inhibitor LprI family protein [Ensifer sp. NPDC090286]|uniref:lysozyme inhibitor LprI family protein n=1 Tax=Ensifer sp. NPDC090286 TaxID=3363991 RepID=UPI00383B3165
MRYAVVAVAFALPLASAFAQEEEVDCQNAVTQSDMNICANEDYEAADAELNKTYKQALAATQAQDQELADIDAAYVGAEQALKKSQRAWIGYRDGQCELAGFEARGGSMEPMLVSGCLAELTKARTKELNAIAAPEGN